MSLRTKIKLQNDEGVRTYEESQKRGIGRLFAGGLAVGASLITRDLAKKTTGKTAEVVCSSTATGLMAYVALDTALSCVTFPVALTKFSKKKSVAGAYFKNYDNSTGWSIATDEQGNEIRQYNPDKDNRIILYSSNEEDQERAYNYLKTENKVKGFREAFKDEHANLLKRIYVDYVDTDDEGKFSACRRALKEAGISESVQKSIQEDVVKNGVVTRKSMKLVDPSARKVLDKIACWDFCQEIQKNAKNEYSKFESLEHLRGSLYLTPEQIRIFDKKGGKLSNFRAFGINKFPFTEEQYKLLVSYKGGSIKDLARIEVLRRRINKEQEKKTVNQKVVNDAVAEIDDIQKRIIDAASSHRKRLRVPFTNSGSTPFVVGKKFRVLNGTIGERLQRRSARKKAAKNTTEALEASFSNNIFPITKVLSRPIAGSINYIQKRIRYGKLYSKHKQIFGHNGFEARNKGMHAADVWCDTSSRFDKIERKYMKLGLTDIVEENNQGNVSNMAVGYVKESAKSKLPAMTNGIISSIASVTERANKRTDKMRHGTTTYLDNPVMVQIYLDNDSNDKKVLPSATLNIDHDDVLEGAMQGLIEDVKNGNIKASEINNISFMAGDRKVVVYREQLNKVWEDAKRGVPFKETRIAKSLAQICTKEKFPKVIDVDAYEAWIADPKASQAASEEVKPKLDANSSLGAANVDEDAPENKPAEEIKPSVNNTLSEKDPFVIDYQYGQTGNVDNISFVFQNNSTPKQNVEEKPEVAEQIEIDIDEATKEQPTLSRFEQIEKERELLKDAEQLEIDIDEAIRKGKEAELAEKKIPTALFNKTEKEMPSHNVKETAREMYERASKATLDSATSKYNRMAVDINKSQNNLYAKIDKLNKDYDAAMALLKEARASGNASEIQTAKEDALDVVRELKTSYITIHNLYQANKSASDKETIRNIDDIIADLSDDFNRLLAIDVDVDVDDRKVAFIDAMANQPIGKINAKTNKVSNQTSTTTVAANNTTATNGKGATTTSVAGNSTSANTSNAPVVSTAKPATANSAFDRLEKKVKAIERKCATISKRITSFEDVSLPKLKAINDEVKANNRYAFTISERERKVESARDELATTSEFMRDAQAIINKIKGKTFNELTDEERNAEAKAFEEAKKTSKTMTGVNRETINDKKEIQSAITESKELGIKPKKSKQGANKNSNSVS